MKYFLSIFIERFGEFSSCRTNILTVNDLKDLDLMTKAFKNSTELRTFFQEEIEKFKEQFAHKLGLWHYRHPGKTNNCKIYANYIAKNGSKSFLATIPIMYQNSELVPFNEAMEHLFHYLQNDEVLEKLWKEKRYLLLDDMDGIEYDLAKSYFDYLKDELVKKELINHFLNRISRMNDENRYRYFRCLMNMCHLTVHEIYTDKGDIKLFNRPPKDECVLENGDFRGFTVDEEYLDDLLMHHNDEQIYNLYSVDEIERRRK